MRISTFNIQNDIRVYKKDKSKKIINYLEKNHIDILGLQEVFSTCSSDLLTMLSEKYKMIGKFRYILKPFFPHKNEKNPIITRYKILSQKTYYLPFIPSKYKRVVTHLVVEYKNREISIYNTHLEISIKSVKEKQLNKIYNLLKNDNRPKILMGDFNSETNDELFKDFIESLKELNINKISIEERTYKLSKDPWEIDHIFISDDFEVKNKKVIKNLDLSDHYPIFVELNLK